MNTTVFDLETCPLPIGELKDAIPPFDPDAVKYGNAKDPEKRANILAEAERKHTQNFIDNAALDPRTGRIKVAGFRDVEKGVNRLMIWEPSASKDIPDWCGDVFNDVFRDYKAFLAAVEMRIAATVFGESPMPTRGTLIGYCIHDFDLPFLFQAAWMNGIPANVRHYRRGRYWNDNIVDIRETWTFGERYAATGGLDGLCKLLNTKTRKTGDGKNFHLLWEQDPKAALEYVISDLGATEDAARSMGEI